MAKQETMASFQETVRSMARGYKLWHQYAPKLLPSAALYSAFSAVSPYVTIYLSSQILNELAGERDPQRLLWLVVLWKLSPFPKHFFPSPNCGCISSRWWVYYITEQKALLH